MRPSTVVSEADTFLATSEIVTLIVLLEAAVALSAFAKPTLSTRIVNSDPSDFEKVFLASALLLMMISFDYGCTSYLSSSGVIAVGVPFASTVNKVVVSAESTADSANLITLTPETSRKFSSVIMSQAGEYRRPYL